MLNVILALSGVLLTGTQTVLIALHRKALCFNEGCAIVDGLTKIPTVFFNLAGFLYFGAIFYILLRARTGSDVWRQLASLFLLGGMAAEGVLVAFQHYIVGVFCSYCLVVFGFVVLINLFAGVKQFMRGVAVFVAVLVAFSVLHFSSPQTSRPISAGTYGSVAGESGGKQLLFFFSETCPHCEEIIEGMRVQNSCEIQFNPVGKISLPPIDSIKKTKSYDPAVNVSFLKNLAINEIPVLVIFDREEVIVLKGKLHIKEYLEKNCGGVSVSKLENTSKNGESRTSSDGKLDYIFSDEDTNCEVQGTADCK